MKSRGVRHARGQGLIEYALILVLVAVVVVVSASLLGQAVQRVYAIVGGAVGAKYDSTGDHTIQITTAACITRYTDNLTGLTVVGITNEDAADLTASSDREYATINGLPAAVESNGPYGFRFNYLLSSSPDTSVCPKSVTIQAKDGAIAFSPVEQVIVTPAPPAE